MRNVGQVPDLPRTRPRPILGPINESGANGIPFNVPHYPVKFPAVANPMIVTFVLPERQSRSAEDHVGSFGAGFLDGARHIGHWPMGTEQNMDVVRHHHPSEQLVKPPLALRKQQGIDDACGNVRVFQLRGAGIGAVHLTVEGEEALAFREFFYWQVGNLPHVRQRPMESPGQEDWRSFRVPVWQSAAVEAHSNIVVASHNISHWQVGNLPHEGIDNAA